MVATLGPACDGAGVLEAMVDAGMDVARVALAHETVGRQVDRLRAARAAADRRGRALGVLADLPGPKVRTGAFPEGGVFLSEGQSVRLVEGDGESGDGYIAVGLADAVAGLRPDDEVTLGDGAVLLKVTRAEKGAASATVLRGGRVLGRPGVHLPAGRLDLKSPTEHDLELLRKCTREGVDIVAVSLVRSAADVRTVREAAGQDPPMVVAKIETRAAVENLEEIVAAADGLMVARGDLGNRLRLEDVPHVQKRVIRTCAESGVPVITATQMLESMIHAPMPTRAEVSDVANAVFDGTDAVMLSGETAIGADPAGVVRTMASIAERAEREADYPQWGGRLARLQRSNSPSAAALRITDALCQACWQAASSVGAAAILCCTRSGATARAMARFRPIAPMVALSPRGRTARQLTLTWGVLPVAVDEYTSVDEIVWFAVERAWRLGVVAKGDVVAVLAGPPDDPEPTTDVLRLVRVR
ncbi:MAG TPA: pyruvate kinase [Acidimicrobiales bacterium]|nr:pyruvate kinase [Acidimicrobiales bacterium]